MLFVALLINIDVKEIGGWIHLYCIVLDVYWIDKYEIEAESHLSFNIVTVDCAIDRFVYTRAYENVSTDISTD